MPNDYLGIIRHKYGQKMLLSREIILSTLAKIKDPASNKNLVSANLIKGLTVKVDEVKFLIEIDYGEKEKYTNTKSEAESAIKQLKENLAVKVFLTAHKKSLEPQHMKKPPDLKIGRHPQVQTNKISPPGVKKIVAIGSGKGGVGKSTLTANLAVALSKQGFKVGLLDADIYGPSQPKIMGIFGKPQIGGVNGKSILPLKNHGVTLMSMGFLVDPGEAVVWRGPMLMGALQQFMGQVEWGELDILLIDLPPGTGDVQLTLAQKCELDGALIISTPQDIALIDAKKAMQMFYKLNVPILGMVENMSTHICVNCGYKQDLFGHGGVEQEAKKTKIDFLGGIPLDIKIRESSDRGEPITLGNSNNLQAAAFVQISEKLTQKLEFVKT